MNKWLNFILNFSFSWFSTKVCRWVQRLSIMSSLGLVLITLATMCGYSCAQSWFHCGAIPLPGYIPYAKGCTGKGERVLPCTPGLSMYTLPIYSITLTLQLHFTVTLYPYLFYPDSEMGKPLCGWIQFFRWHWPKYWFHIVIYIWTSQWTGKTDVRLPNLSPVHKDVIFRCFCGNVCEWPAAAGAW